MANNKRELKAAREEKRAREKRARRVQRDTRRSQVKMTVVNISPGQSALSLTNEVQLCNSALLYADEVTLVSPRAALLKNASDVSNLDGIELLRVLKNVAPKYFPDIDEELRSTFEIVDSVPRSRLPRDKRNEYDASVRLLTEQLKPIREKMQENVRMIFGESGYHQLQEAIELGLLVVDEVAGAVVDDLSDEGEMVLGFTQKIDQVLSDGSRYPLFDANASDLVRQGVEAGYFSPVPAARRLGAAAAMADGLFDRLPNFQNATPREIIDIRTELSGSLSAFRVGIRSMTDEIDLPPEDPNFGNEIADAWNQKVAPALDEIESTIAENRSMSDLLRRVVKDPLAGASTAGGLVLPLTLSVAVGPASAYLATAGVGAGYGVAAVRAFIDEHQEIRAAKKAQFYFLYGTGERLRRQQA